MWLVFVVVAVVLMLMLGMFDPDTGLEYRCPTCGLVECVPVYEGAFRRTGELVCRRCGAVTSRS